ncbi:MAG: VOC family protein [Ilumatobacteraceae bacterium]
MAPGVQHDGPLEETHQLRPTTVRWTHIALPSTDIDASIRWYEAFTPLRLLDRREDADGYGRGSDTPTWPTSRSSSCW